MPVSIVLAHHFKLPFLLRLGFRLLLLLLWGKGLFRWGRPLRHALLELGGFFPLLGLLLFLAEFGHPGFLSLKVSESLCFDCFVLSSFLKDLVFQLLLLPLHLVS
jgi:hypothetical protein